METGARPKRKGGRIVPSRYLQYDKTGGKGTSSTNMSFAKSLENVGSPKRPSVQKFKTSVESAPSILQSTFLDSHESTRPELEVSVINVSEKSRFKTPVSKLNIKGFSQKKKVLTSSDSDDLIGMLDSQTLLLTYASLKVGKNLALLEGKAERNLLALCEEVKKLQKNAHDRKHKLQHLKKNTELSEALERQLEILGLVCEQCAQFRKDYKHFATALDTTRHELPMKGIYVEDMGQHLADMQKSLAMLQRVSKEALLQNSEENAKALNVMKELEEVSLKLDEELLRNFKRVVDLSADVSKEASLHYQNVCEDTLGLETMNQLYFT